MILINYYFTFVNNLLERSIFKKIIEYPIYTSIFVFLVTLFFSFPSYDIALYTNEMKESWDAIFLQAKEPFTNHNHLYSVGSHAEKLAFRFVPALFLKILQIKTMQGAFIFQLIILFLFIYFLNSLFNKYFDKKYSFLASIAISLTVSGHVYCSDYRGIFDTVALLFIILSFLSINKFYLVFFLLFAFFTDERAIIASLAFPLFIIIKDNFSFFKFKWIFEKSIIFYVFSLVCYIAIRVFLKCKFNLEIGPGRLDYFFEQIDKIHYAIYIGFEGFIILFFLFIKKYNLNYFNKILFFIGVGLILYTALSVLDINRSMSYILPFLIILIYTNYSKTQIDKSLKTLLIVILINMIYDDFYPFILQLYRMFFITKLI